MDIDRMNRFNVSSVETFLDKLLRGSVTDNLYFGEMPTTMPKDCKEFVVVDVGNVLRDHGAYENGTVLILLYAKNNSYGRKNVRTLQSLEKKLNVAIANSNDSDYRISHRGSYSNYDAVNDIYYNIVQLSLIVI